jgi:D-sedoheptulose 7-phosphate isomerase
VRGRKLRKARCVYPASAPVTTRTDIPPDSYGSSFEPVEIASLHLRSLTQLLQEVDYGALERVVHRLRLARDTGATIFAGGNGGSASTATHWVNDLCKAATCTGRAPIRAMSLSDNVSWMTALANDEGYERVFAAQLENFAKAGDVLVVISASGNSPNLVQAVDLANERGVTTIGLLGFDGGSLRAKVSDCVWLSTDPGEYELVESGHSALCHALSLCLAQDLGPTADTR